MAVKRPKRLPPITRVPCEEVAIAICEVINRDCPCKRAPGVCSIMIFAARAALRTGAPEAAEKIFKAEMDAALAPR